MKNIAKWIALPAMFAALLWSCKKEEDKDYYLGGTTPVLSASDTALKFVPADSNKTAITFTWTNPNYKFTTGISSQNVNYTLQIDTLGANFTNPKMFTLSISSDLSKAFSVTEINSDLANTMGLATGMSHTVQVRVVTSLGSANAGILYSNVLQFKVTPYAPPPAVTVPISGKLYITGDATAGGWQSGGASGTSEDPSKGVPVPSQQFKQVSATDYQITLPLIGGGQYLLLPLNGNWNYKYALKDNTVAGISGGGSFNYNNTNSAYNANFVAPTASGNYLIDVNFQTGIFTVTKQ